MGGSNCTFMELKWDTPELIGRKVTRSNCTFMELK